MFEAIQVMDGTVLFGIGSILVALIMALVQCLGMRKKREQGNC